MFINAREQKAAEFLKGETLPLFDKGMAADQSYHVKNYPLSMDILEGGIQAGRRRFRQACCKFSVPCALPAGKETFDKNHAGFNMAAA